ncbi:uncharacterized protein MONBRDRAFT_25069 [Monosiga brevicollis MX1]|uniref:Receptor L-domain domain-containing protein n=1 Tax=Monosiga brevicollis TaxID=81824 RepID=A9UYB8_MONBE|nr:uncharacterized protein MONBRDRAFT_25069 [Monosiga brevicollis MX1]EDQ89577.1 predicted protein [Monosiga brevicollis MX1]|eukprot:XP_001745606.1 hypothetical protein [Monosiga brevicollis MX1]
MDVLAELSVLQHAAESMMGPEVTPAASPRAGAAPCSPQTDLSLHNSIKVDEHGNVFFNVSQSHQRIWLNGVDFLQALDDLRRLVDALEEISPNPTPVPVIHTGDVTCNLSAFSPATTVIQGNLNLDSCGAALNAVALQRLGRVTRIDGGVRINRNSGLADIEGLHSLTHIQGHLQINDNPALRNIDGLRSLIFLGAHLNIASNLGLASIGGLSSLTNITQSLDIKYNHELTTLDGLGGITQVGTYVSIAVGHAGTAHLDDLA